MDKILPSVPQGIPSELRVNRMYCLRDRTEKEASETPPNDLRTIDYSFEPSDFKTCGPQASLATSLTVSSTMSNATSSISLCIVSGGDSRNVEAPQVTTATPRFQERLITSAAF